MTDTLRIRGEEIQIRLTRNGVLEATLTAVKSLVFTPKFSVLTEGYLGGTTNRRDDIYQGCTVQLVFHPESSDALTLMDFVRSRATRRVAQANARVNLMFVANFPNGNRPRVTISDLKFGDMPFNMGGREQYVDQTISAEADDFKLSLQ